MKVAITHDLRLLASVWGSFRTFTSRTAGVKDQKIGPQSCADADISGLLAELAFCQAMNVWPDLGMSVRSGSYDCLVKGKRIDIKSTHYPDGHLICKTKINPDVDIYVLAIISDTHIEFKGWAYKNELCRSGNIRNLGGHGEGYVRSEEHTSELQSH